MHWMAIHQSVARIQPNIERANIVAILFYINAVLLALLVLLAAAQYILLRRVILLDHILTHLVGEAFNAQLMRLPIWQAWANIMGDIAVDVSIDRYKWDRGQ